jgi:hypothetical protein
LNDVLKKKKATMLMASQPTMPLVSAGFLHMISMTRMTAIGINVRISKAGLSPCMYYPPFFFYPCAYSLRLPVPNSQRQNPPFWA